ncbi:prenyltransferase [candidate division KSB1 bacterium]|nr:prenyltransferase [candidate division KSB1 bacterium]
MTRPSLVHIVRAPFFSSILAPLLYGSFLSASLNRTFDAINFALVLILGVCVHAATNVYNDIYDTLQGTDRFNRHRNPFSGGSGLLVQQPELIKTFFRVARIAVLGTLASAAVLLFRIDPALRPIFLAIVITAVFFSKYYTAAPIKLAYRGWGEVAVWFAFGPLAIAIAALAQNLFWHPVIWTAMPATGLSTSSILLIGQLIDRQADEAGGKHGVAVRWGSVPAARLYLALQLLLIANIVVVAVMLRPIGLLLLLSLIPYIDLPRTARQVLKNARDPQNLKNAAAANVRIHLLFSSIMAVSSAAIFVFSQ